jgi:mRNA turnover protein 4
VFAFDNMRTARFKDVRSAWSDSRFFLGKNRVMQKALGESSDDAYRAGLDRLAAELVGNVGLLFTNHTPEEVTTFFEEFAEVDYARSGFIPAASVVVPAGRLEDMPHTMHETLVKLGMPVRLERGVIVLPTDHTIAEAGKPITPEQGRLLKHFGHALAVFKLHLVAHWHDGTTKLLGYTGDRGVRGGLSLDAEGGHDDESDGDSDGDSDAAGAAGAGASDVAAAMKVGKKKAKAAAATAPEAGKGGSAGGKGKGGGKAAAAAAAAAAAPPPPPPPPAAAGGGGGGKGKGRKGKGGDADEGMGV